MRELHAFKKSKIVVCATTKLDVATEGGDKNAKKAKTLGKNKMTTCLRVFPEIKKIMNLLIFFPIMVKL